MPKWLILGWPNLNPINNMKIHIWSVKGQKFTSSILSAVYYYVSDDRQSFLSGIQISSTFLNYKFLLEKKVHFFLSNCLVQ